ncbi:MAG: PIN domain-containing protein [Oscillospiraceae bacterium]|jgi:predicted nucleic acid-binding protein|nr:PIN domain-containing protein [Oscillospiraceae bacterium]
MSDAKAFIDTNLFVYLYSSSDSEKQQAVIQAMNRYDRFVSTQVLNEFCNVLTRKLKLPIPAVRAAVAEICAVCNLAVVDDATVDAALGIHEKYGFSYYDSLIVSSALESECEYLLSEDLSDRQVIEGSLIVKNIFSE